MKKRKIVSAILIMTTIGFAQISAFGAGFKDIKGHWAETQIIQMADRGIVSGRSTTEFAPDENMKRSELITLIMRTLQIPADPHTYSYGDIKANEWYANYVQGAYNSGIIDTNMLVNGNFLPEQPITREEMASVVIKSIGLSTSAAPELFLSDVNTIAPWARGSVAKAFELGIMVGRTPTTFDPRAKLTRAEATVIIKRVLDGNYTSLLYATPTPVPTPIPTPSPTPEIKVQSVDFIIDMKLTESAFMLKCHEAEGSLIQKYAVTEDDREKIVSAVEYVKDLYFKYERSAPDYYILSNNKQIEITTTDNMAYIKVFGE